MDHNLEYARNVKLLLTAIEQLSCLKINFHKSDFFVMGLLRNGTNIIHVFFDVVLAKKLSNWKGKFLSSKR
jgi:hypothetical protein